MIETTNLGALHCPDQGGDRTALIDCLHWEAPRCYTHRELDEAANACARGLLARGHVRGERVAIVSANRAEFLIAYLGILRAGLVAVPISHKFPVEIIRFILDDASVRLVLGDGPRRDPIPSGHDFVCFDDTDATGFQSLLVPGHLDAVRPGTEEVAMILYTSGSTGRPKGVPLTHRGHLWALRLRVGEGFAFKAHRLLVAAPLYHMNALCVSLFAITSAASMVLLPEFDAVRYLQAIERHRCTWITSVPAMLAMCFQETATLSACDLSSVSVVRMGSAPISPKLLAQVKRTFAGAGVMNGYGTTEAGPMVFGPRDGQAPPDGSPGWPLEDVDVKLIDSQGRESEQGVLWQRTPAVMPHYLNLPDKTREVLTEDGWYISGDIFRRDAAGAYHFVGRDDDMFVCGGENVHPGEVEGVLLTHPDVAQSCVVPVPDELKGHKPVAFVVAEPGAHLDEAALRRHALRRTPAYQHPRRVFVVDTLPLAGPGKVDRNALTRRAAALWEAGESPPV